MLSFFGKQPSQDAGDGAQDGRESVMSIADFLDDDVPAAFFPSAKPRASSRASEAAVQLPPVPHALLCIQLYAAQVRGGHEHVTAADLLYFQLLQLQRSHDLIEVHEKAAVAQRAEGDDAKTYNWQAELARRKAEATEGIVERAKHYAVGKLSEESGLLRFAKDAAEKGLVLQHFRGQLEEEYAAAAHEIGSSLEAIVQMQEAQFTSYLSNLKRREEFCESEITECFDAWEQVSKSLNEGGYQQGCTWSELTETSGTVLAWASANTSTAWSSWNPLQWLTAIFMPGNERGRRLLVELGGCLLEASRRQETHSLESPEAAERDTILASALQASRRHGCLPDVGRYLLRASMETTLGAAEKADPAKAGDAQGGPPWRPWVVEVLGELLLDLAAQGPPLPGWPEAVREITAVRILGDGPAGCREAQVALRTSVVSYKDCKGRTALHVAVSLGHASLVRRLLAVGANPNTRDGNDMSAVALARRIAHGDENILLALETAVGSGRAEARLMEMAKAGDVRGCAALLDGGAQVDCKDSVTGRTPLHLAADAANKTLATLLLRRKADTEVWDGKKARPLHAAALGRHAEMVKFLIASKAIVDAQDEAGFTALGHAVSKRDAQLCQLLVQKGASVNMPMGPQDKTPLDRARTMPEILAVLRGS